MHHDDFYVTNNHKSNQEISKRGFIDWLKQSKKQHSVKGLGDSQTNKKLFELASAKLEIDFNNLQDNLKNRELIQFTQKYLHLKYLKQNGLSKKAENLPLRKKNTIRKILKNDTDFINFFKNTKLWKAKIFITKFMIDNEIINKTQKNRNIDLKIKTNYKTDEQIILCTITVPDNKLNLIHEQIFIIKISNYSEDLEHLKSSIMPNKTKIDYLFKKISKDIFTQCAKIYEKVHNKDLEIGTVPTQYKNKFTIDENQNIIVFTTSKIIFIDQYLQKIGENFLLNKLHKNFPKNRRPYKILISDKSKKIYYVFSNSLTSISVFILDPNQQDFKMLYFEFKIIEIMSLFFDPFNKGSFYVVSKTKLYKLNYKIIQNKKDQIVTHELNASQRIANGELFGFGSKEFQYWTITNRYLILIENQIKVAKYKHQFKIGKITRIQSFEIETGNSPSFTLVICQNDTSCFIFNLSNSESLVIFKYKLKNTRFMNFDKINFTLILNQENSIILIPIVNKIFKLNKLFTKLNKTKLKSSLKYIIDHEHLVIMGSRGILLIHQTKKKIKPLNVIDLFADSVNYHTLRDKFIIINSGEIAFFVTNSLLKDKYKSPQQISWFLIRICLYELSSYSVLWGIKKSKLTNSAIYNESVQQVELLNLSEIANSSSDNTHFNVLFKVTKLMNKSLHEFILEVSYSRDEDCKFIKGASNPDKTTSMQMSREINYSESKSSDDSWNLFRGAVKTEESKDVVTKELNEAENQNQNLLLNYKMKALNQVKSFLCLENTAEYVILMIRQQQTYVKKSMNIWKISKKFAMLTVLLEDNFDFEIKTFGKTYISTFKRIVHGAKTVYFIIYNDVFCVFEQTLTEEGEIKFANKFHINFIDFFMYQHDKEMNQVFFVFDSKLFIWDLKESNMIFKIKISKFFDQLYGKFLFNKEQKTLICFPKLLKYTEVDEEKQYLITVCMKRFEVINKNQFYIPHNLAFQEITYDYSDLIDYYTCFHLEDNVFLRCGASIYQISNSILDSMQYHAIIPPLMFLKQHIPKLFRNTDTFINEIDSYCQFIFLHLKETNYVDYYFKSLNPYILLIYYNRPFVLRRVLRKFGLCFIPTSSYYGIFEFCLRLFRKECLKEIRTFIMEQSVPKFKMNYHDYNSMLKSNLLNNHVFLSKLFQPNDNSITPDFISMEGRLEVKEYKNVSILLIEESKHLQQSQKKQINELNERFETFEFDSKNKSKTGNFVTDVTLPFDLDLSLGSLESINLLNFYSFTLSDDFIESDFRHLIEKKWNSLKTSHYLNTLNFLLFALIFIVSSVFLPHNLALSWINKVYIIIMIIIEVFEIVSTSFYHISVYFKDLKNFMDIIISLFILVFVFHDLIFENYTSTNFKVFHSCVIFFIMMRAFFHLQVFPLFRTMTGIINKVFMRLIPFFFIVVFYYFICFFVFVVINKSFEPVALLRLLYISIIFGGIEDDTFTENQLHFIPVLFGTIIITIVLMNILIAYLSNEYSRLEEKQNLDDLRMKAQINFKIEILIRSCKYMFNKEFRKKEKFRESRYQNMMKNILGYEITPEELDKAKNIHKKKIWIFSVVDNQDSSAQKSNVSFKLNKLSKMVNIQFQSINSQMKKLVNSNHQNKTKIELSQNSLKSDISFLIERVNLIEATNSSFKKNMDSKFEEINLKISDFINLLQKKS